MSGKDSLSPTAISLGFPATPASSRHAKRTERNGEWPGNGARMGWILLGFFGSGHEISMGLTMGLT